MQNIIEIRDLTFEYLMEPVSSEEKGDKTAKSGGASGGVSGSSGTENESAVERVTAIDHVSFAVEEGSFTAIIGQNGSGKSTLAKNLNGLLLPTSGKVLVNGWDTADDDHIWDVRQTAGMVFQNPDNQLVSSIVENDVAFGPENLGVDPKVIRERVDQALSAVEMGEYRKQAPHNLSGGQKQRIAIAGVIAMRPKCIIFDEPTAMLDPQGRKEILRIIHQLHEEGITVILITHFMDEAVQADRIIVMNEGKILMDGTPEEVFRNSAKIREINLDVPIAVELSERLRRRGIRIPSGLVTEDAFIDFVCGDDGAEAPEDQHSAANNGSTGNAGNTGNTGSTGNNGSAGSAGNSGSTGNTGSAESAKAAAGAGEDPDAEMG
ncbi:MAG: energy-coupling factor transporter ATPase [Anaerovoracaceae bacterium]|jgi:energy-coupling factor transport system ATP-binding protein